ncbi:MAG: ferrochelatase, partial [bacterium]
MTPKADAVLLLAFGGPEAREEIRPFLEEALRGRGAPPERLEEVARHYEAIGGLSPIGALTRAQAAALEAELARRGRPLPVRVGMRNWRPFLADALGALADEGRREVVVVVLAPHGGEASRGRYDAALAAAMRALGPRAPAVRVAAPFGGRAEFIDTMAKALLSEREARSEWGDGLIHAWRAEEHDGQQLRFFRVHSSGDFFSHNYAAAWLDLCRRMERE